MMADTDTQTRISQVGTVFVPVADQDRALEFSLGKLGFEKRGDFPYGGGSRWVEVAPYRLTPRDRDTSPGGSYGTLGADVAALCGRSARRGFLVRHGPVVPDDPFGVAMDHLGCVGRLCFVPGAGE
jgi:hypothetical protein